MNSRASGLMPQVTFNILFALSLKPRHGYELIQQIQADSGGKIRLGPGALYGAIKQLREEGLIEEMPFEDKSQRRRYYRLTKKGWDQLKGQLEYLDSTVRLARERKLIGDLQGIVQWQT